MRMLALLLALPIAAQAQATMTAEAFDRATLGKTILYGTAEGAYGIEEYLPGHRVRWSFLDGDCLDGQWYASGPAICFVYEDQPAPHCWLFRDAAGGITAEFLEDGGDPGPLVALSATEEPLYCTGPKVGV